MVERIECVVIGAGVVGLATARALARVGREVLVLEASDAIGTETSSRNSEVIHAGIYYPKGSLKARLCVEGKTRLYRYCASRGVPHKRLGKMIVATDAAEDAVLLRLRETARGNGVDDLAPLDAATARAMEPALFCTSALLSPSTGIVDSHQLMLAYQGECESRGGALAFNSRVSAGALREGGFEIETADGTRLSCALLVNSAGLGAQRVARSLAGFPAGRIPEAWLVKGNYFTLQGKPPFTRLIYPVPAHAGLGVHVTLDLAGQVRFGPDTEDIDRLDYAVDPRRGDSFYAAIRRYYPALADGAILPGYAGIRPKLASAKTGQADFIIQGPESHRVPGLINYFGIESPGLTASLALADEALRRLGIAPAADD